jgi:glyoxylase I family protein
MSEEGPSAEGSDEMIEKVRTGGYEVIVEPNDKVFQSNPPYHIRMAFCLGPLGEQIEFFCEKRL